jgi:F-type H+-transporting ATPase subunit b
MKKIFTTLLVTAAAANAFAAGAPGEGYNWDFLVKNFGFRVLVFAILVFILVKLLRKPLTAMLDKRSKDIEQSIKTAEEANETAKTEIESYKLKVKGFEKDLETMKQKALEMAENEQKSILEEAEKQIEKLSKLAEGRIESEYKRASEELKQKAVVAALEAAQAKLGQELSPEKQSEILGSYIKKIGVIK